MNTTTEICHNFFAVSPATKQTKKIIDNLCDFISRNKQRFSVQYVILANSLRREAKNKSTYNDFVELLQKVLKNNNKIEDDFRWNAIAKMFYITEILLNIGIDKVSPLQQDDLKRKYGEILSQNIQEKYHLKNSDWTALYRSSELLNVIVGVGVIGLFYYIAVKILE